MKVTFRTNLGSVDAKALNLDHKKCTAGATLDVDKGIAEKLIERGIATTTENAKDDALVTSAQGIPDSPEVPEVKAVAAEPGVKNFQKNPHSPKLPE